MHITVILLTNIVRYTWDFVIQLFREKLSYKSANPYAAMPNGFFS